MHTKPAENGRSPSSQKEFCNQRGRRQAIPAAVKHKLVRRAGGQCMYLAPDENRLLFKKIFFGFTKKFKQIAIIQRGQ